MNNSDQHSSELSKYPFYHSDDEPGPDFNDEAKIWEDFKSGSEEALVYIYRNYVDILYKYGQQFNKDKELLKDALQELFLELIKNKAKLSKTNSIKFYLFRSYRRIIAKKTKNAIFQQTNIEDHANDLAVDLDPETIYIQGQIDQEQKILLRKAIENLNPVQKEAICLYFFEGFSYAKIAEIFEYSNVKSVRNIIYHAIDEMTAFVKKTGSNLDFFLLLSLPLLQ